MSSKLPQNENRPSEMPAARTTIVGGRPPGSGIPIGTIPRGLEILIKRAAIDPEFKTLLLAKRSGAAGEVDLTLEPTEAAMLDSVPAEQLQAIIANTRVPEASRRALLGKVTATTLAALGVAAIASSCRDEHPPQPDPASAAPAESTPEQREKVEDRHEVEYPQSSLDDVIIIRGIRP
jgi:hypothetical protein